MISTSLYSVILLVQNGRTRQQGIGGFTMASTVHPSLWGFTLQISDTLNKKATVIAFGGAVNVVTSHTTPLPPMGSGSFPSGRAATLSSISLIQGDGMVTPINVETITIVIKSRCYSATPISGGMFSYGGPGGCSAAQEV